jgi:hypothetical protein
MVLPMVEELLVARAGFRTGACCLESSTRTGAVLAGFGSMACRLGGERMVQVASLEGADVLLAVQADTGMACRCGSESRTRGCRGGEEARCAAVMATTDCEYTYPALGDGEWSQWTCTRAETPRADLCACFRRWVADGGEVSGRRRLTCFAGRVGQVRSCRGGWRRGRREGHS